MKLCLDSKHSTFIIFYYDYRIVDLESTLTKFLPISPLYFLRESSDWLGDPFPTLCIPCILILELTTQSGFVTSTFATPEILDININKILNFPIKSACRLFYSYRIKLYNSFTCRASKKQISNCVWRLISCAINVNTN